MADICGDDRFEIIKKAKAELLKSTNIDTSEDEMKVLDNFLFRCWQMGWLDRYDETKTNWIKVEDRLPEAKYRTDIEKGYSDVVLVCGFRYTPKGVRCSFSDVAYYDHEYRKWYDQNDDAIAGGVTNWMPIVLPIEEDEE